MNEQKFFVCKHCGNLVGLINNAKVPMICCGEKMTELVPNTTDGAKEKHIPVVLVNENVVKVQIGEVMHPMTDEHSIEWIYLQTDKGGQRKSLKVGHEPVTTFAVIDDKPIAVFAYCNLHGLWKKEL